MILVKFCCWIGPGMLPDTLRSQLLDWPRHMNGPDSVGESRHRHSIVDTPNSVGRLYTSVGFWTRFRSQSKFYIPWKKSATFFVWPLWWAEQNCTGAERRADLFWTVLCDYCELSVQIYARIDRNHYNIHLSRVFESLRSPQWPNEKSCVFF